MWAGTVLKITTVVVGAGVLVIGGGAGLLLRLGDLYQQADQEDDALDLVLERVPAGGRS